MIANKIYRKTKKKNKKHHKNLLRAFKKSLSYINNIDFGITEEKYESLSVLYIYTYIYLLKYWAGDMKIIQKSIFK